MKTIHSYIANINTTEIIVERITWNKIIQVPSQRVSQGFSSKRNTKKSVEEEKRYQFTTNFATKCYSSIMR
jgi:hypothetical protein